MSPRLAVTQEIVDTIRRAGVSFVASINQDGSPNLAPIASLDVYDGGLMFANMASRTTIANLRRDPRVTVVVIDFFRRRGFRMAGTATIWGPGTACYDLGAERVWSAHGRSYPVHDVATVAVEQTAPLVSPAYRFGQGISEAAVEAAFLRRYGVSRVGPPEP